MNSLGIIIIFALFFAAIALLILSENKKLESNMYITETVGSTEQLTQTSANLSIKIYDILANKTDWKFILHENSNGYYLGSYTSDKFYFQKNCENFWDEILTIEALDYYAGSIIHIKSNKLDVKFSNDDLFKRLREYGKECKKEDLNTAINSI